MRAARLFAAGEIWAEAIDAPEAPGPSEVLLAGQGAGLKTIVRPDLP